MQKREAIVPLLKDHHVGPLQHMNKSFHVSESGDICVTRMYECKRNLKKNGNLFQQPLKDNGVLEMEEQIKSVIDPKPRWTTNCTIYDSSPKSLEEQTRAS